MNICKLLFTDPKAVAACGNFFTELQKEIASGELETDVSEFAGVVAKLPGAAVKLSNAIRNIELMNYIIMVLIVLVIVFLIVIMLFQL